jgi:hypothetical protein
MLREGCVRPLGACDLAQTLTLAVGLWYCCLSVDVCSGICRLTASVTQRIMKSSNNFIPGEQ